MTTDDHDHVRNLLQDVEHRLPVDADARVRTRRATLELFDNAVFSRQASHQIEWDQMDASADVIPLAPATAVQHRRRTILAVAAAIVFAFIGVGVLILDESPEDDVVSVANDGTPDIGDQEGSGPFDASALVDGLRFDIPTRLDLVTTSDGRLTFDRGSAGSNAATDITVLVVDRWGEPVLVDGLPPVDEPQTLVDWLADSSTDESEFVFRESHPEGALTVAWLVRLSTAGASAVGCPTEGPCGEVAFAPDGSAVSLDADMLTELISIEIPGQRPLLVHTSYPEDTVSDEVAGELARSIVSGFYESADN
ncbi:MAG: hypothetical protein HKN94_05190 [Acidimicrobiales bacterium]|nr:hypothetical protein [Acidimicrobiales bacterium]RZV46906.1 MAG: hypothetical protein EX269_06050 [Acidimicrobiales bacterium]